MPEDGRGNDRHFAQTVAAWVVARPQNGVLALAATLALPVLQLVSGALIVLLVLRRGVRDAALYGVIAGLLLVAMALVTRAPAGMVAGSIAVVLMPSLLFGLLLQWTRSLTLTLQVSVIVAALATLGFGLAVADPVAYWQPVMQALVEWARQNDLHLQADALEAEPAMAANMMTLAFVLTRWAIVTVVGLLGYWLARSLGGESGDYGRFRDLNLGRVIALTMAIASVIAWLAGPDWLQNVAVVMFATFWLQGLAVMHWLQAHGQLPAFVIIATYALMVVLHVFLLLTLAVLGYTDAWFDYRSRASRKLKG
ncbi:MAG: DUF2232 domain-containing protein [Woeseiaceae bacterium]|nr:DUF2232 domain-containing protein [Woeseiaceae bacterium]